VDVKVVDAGRRWVPVVAAGAVLGIAGATFAIVNGSTPAGTVDPPAVAGPSTPAATATATTAPVRPEDLVVRDGVEVEASGTVLSTPGRRDRFCAPQMDTGFRRPGEEGQPACTFGITVVGVDLDALTGAGTAGASRFGQAKLRGVFQGGTLTVAAQAPPAARPAPTIARETPCPPPPGGWKPGTSPTSNDLHRYMYDEHPEQFRPLYVTYPDGIPAGPSPPGDAPAVLNVEVVRGDVDQVRAELVRLFTGNLCVVARPGLPSIADQEQLERDLRPTLDRLMRDQTNGIYAVSFRERVTFELVMVTPALFDEFSALGFDIVDADPWLRPVR
jgi:hypothetical protein